MRLLRTFTILIVSKEMESSWTLHLDERFTVEILRLQGLFLGINFQERIPRIRLVISYHRTFKNVIGSGQTINLVMIRFIIYFSSLKKQTLEFVGKYLVDKLGLPSLINDKKPL